MCESHAECVSFNVIYYHGIKFICMHWLSKQFGIWKNGPISMPHNLYFIVYCRIFLFKKINFIDNNIKWTPEFLSKFLPQYWNGRTKCWLKPCEVQFLDQIYCKYFRSNNVHPAKRGFCSIFTTEQYRFGDDANAMQKPLGNACIELESFRSEPMHQNVFAKQH